MGWYQRRVHGKQWYQRSTWVLRSVEQERKRSKLRVRKKRIIHGRLNASWKICFLVVNCQSFLVIDGYLLNLFWFEKKKKKKKKKKKFPALIPPLKKKKKKKKKS